MKRTLTLLTVLSLTIAAEAQTLNIQTGNVVYQFPAAQTGDMTFTDGTQLTVMGRTFTLADISSMTVDNSEVTDNLVSVEYNGTDVTIHVAGNVAQYVEPTCSGAHVTIQQTNSDAVDGNEITYQLSGTSSNGSLTLTGEYKCSISLDGLTLTNPAGAAISIANSKRIQISAKKDTENTLADCAEGSQKACIYSKGQLQLQGNGTLHIVGNTKHAIKSASYIAVKNLTLNITSAVGDGISCEEYFQMKSGTVNISGVGDDGIQCDLGGTASTGETSLHTDEDTGNIYVEGGTLTVTVPKTATAGKCMKSDGDIQLTGGTLTLNAYGNIDLTDTTDPSTTAGVKAEGSVVLQGSDATINVTGAAGRGVGAATFTAKSGTLAVNNSGALSSSGSSYFYTAKSVKADAIDIDGGTLTITTSGAASKGISGDAVTITGGNINVTTSGNGATDGTEADGKGAAGLNSDGDITISGGTLTLKNTGTGGKSIKADGTLTVSDNANITATNSASNYSSGSYSASAKAIKAGTRTVSESSVKAYGPGGGGNPGGGGGGGGFPGGGGGGDNTNYDYTGGIVVKGGAIIATASSHEAIESKSTIDISGGYIYAESSDDAINSASTFNITGGYVMGYSTGNDGLDANGNFNISGGNVVTIAAGSPEVGLDANTEGGYKLTITGGNVVAVGGLESGSSLSGVTSKSASFSRNTWYTFKSGSTSQFSFKIPSASGSGRTATSMTIVASSTPSITSGSITGTSIWNGYGVAGN